MKLRMASAGLAVLAFTGCQTVPYQGEARNVTVKPQKEGVVSIPTNPRDEDRSKAETLMARNCQPFAPTVLEEGEVAVGTKVDSTGQETKKKSTEREVGSLFGIPLVSGDAGGKSTQASSTTTELKEWRITYRCKQDSKVR